MKVTSPNHLGLPIIYIKSARSLLSRPISISNIEDDMIIFLYEVRGKEQIFF